MAASTSKVSAKITALDASLDELEAKLEPLFAQTLPETVVELEKIQQAKLQVAIPYVLHDLVFIYLKTRGLDPKTHPVVGELDRIRQYFDKIKDAEDPEKRRFAVDKSVANRFIKHAIAQAKFGRPPGQDEGVAGPSNVRVPVKITSKMAARAEYEKQLKEMSSDEEDDLEVIDEASKDESAHDTGSAVAKGKGKAQSPEVASSLQQVTSSKRKRQPMDPFAGYGDGPKETERPAKGAKVSPMVSDIDTPIDSRASTPQSGTDSTKAKKRAAAKKARKKAKQAAPSGV